MYVPNYNDSAIRTIQDQALGQVRFRTGRPGPTSKLFGLGQPTAGEALIATKLDNLHERWQALTGAPFSDYVGLQKLVDQLKLLKGDVSSLIDEPKRSALLKVLNEGIAKQQKYVTQEISIGRAKTRFIAMRNTIKGILVLPTGAPMPVPAAPPAMALKSLIVPAAITAGVATIVGIMLKKAL